MRNMMIRESGNTARMRVATWTGSCALLCGAKIVVTALPPSSVDSASAEGRPGTIVLPVGKRAPTQYICTQLSSRRA